MNIQDKIKFYQTETDQITDSELLQAVLAITAKIADRLVAEFGIDGLRKAGVAELQKIKGVGPKKATQIRALSMLLPRMLSKPLFGTKFTCSKEVYNYIGPKISGRSQESFWLLLLNNRNRIVGEVMVSQGGIASCPVNPADVFRAAIKEEARSIILAHNHPSGDPEPSQEDQDLTKRLCLAADGLGIPILDHLVVCEHSYVSFADKGII